MEYAIGNLLIVSLGYLVIGVALYILNKEKFVTIVAPAEGVQSTRVAKDARKLVSSSLEMAPVPVVTSEEHV